jgi:hypothetical protein
VAPQVFHNREDTELTPSRPIAISIISLPRSEAPPHAGKPGMHQDCPSLFEASAEKRTVSGGCNGLEVPATLKSRLCCSYPSHGLRSTQISHPFPFLVTAITFLILLLLLIPVSQLLISPSFLFNCPPSPCFCWFELRQSISATLLSDNQSYQRLLSVQVGKSIVCFLFSKLEMYLA